MLSNYINRLEAEYCWQIWKSSDIISLSSHVNDIYKKRCFKSFAKYCEVFKNNFFTKHLRNTDNCTSVPQPATLLKNNPGTDVFMWILQIVISEAAVHRYSTKHMFWNSQEHTQAEVLFSVKLQMLGLQPLLKVNFVRAFSFEFIEIFRNNCFTEHSGTIITVLHYY